MEANIVLTSIQVIDLFFRFSAVGVLLALLAHRRDRSLWWVNALIVCSIAYLALTAPIDNHHYGWLRPPLLLLTDLTPVALLGVYWLYVHGRSPISTLKTWQTLPLAAWLIWMLYFFLVEEGRGIYHDINHALGFSLLIFIAIDAARGINDDLVESRRRWRFIMLTAIAGYMASLSLVELTMTDIKDHWLFSTTNSLLALLISLIVAGYSIRSNWEMVSSYRESSQQKPNQSSSRHSTSINDNPTQAKSRSQTHRFDPIVEKLNSAMKAGIYRQNGMSINKLASELAIPAHQLRSAINTELGYENFSSFLNSYRIDEVCAALEDPEQAQLPILTLALNAGFNSIAPFNRAFKHAKGITPTEYRDRFQK